ncbi:hypothetical protein JCM14036_18080 [Desulfotomaculum defluvii]
MDDIHNMLRDLFEDTIQKVIEAEMDTHLGYDKHDPTGDHSGNSRNGYSKKTVQTQMGKAENKIPRDRNGEFEPQIIKKYETTANELEDQIIAMFAFLNLLFTLEIGSNQKLLKCKGLGDRFIAFILPEIAIKKEIAGNNILSYLRQNPVGRSGCSSALPYPPCRQEPL